jgi:hypothetical protein
MIKKKIGRPMSAQFLKMFSFLDRLIWPTAQAFVIAAELIFAKSKFGFLYRSRIHGRTISLRFRGIILRGYGFLKVFPPFSFAVYSN